MTCAECGTRYDSDRDAFCPRCGSLARGAVVPGAVQVARRNDPARRRVQASGALLLVVGGLFLVSSLVGLAVPVEEVSQQFVEPMADQAGGELVLLPGADRTPFDVTVTTVDGDPVANATAQTDPVTVPLAKHAAVHVVVRQATQANATAFDAVVLPGDRLRVQVGEVQSGDVAIGPTLRTTVQVGRYVFIGLALLLAGGGLCALLLRAWPVAATASIVGMVMGLIVLVAFPIVGLLFAVPFGFAGVFVLRGKRHFAKAA